MTSPAHNKSILLEKHVSIYLLDFYDDMTLLIVTNASFILPKKFWNKQALMSIVKKTYRSSLNIKTNTKNLHHWQNYLFHNDHGKGRFDAI